MAKDDSEKGWTWKRELQREKEETARHFPHDFKCDMTSSLIKLVRLVKKTSQSGNSEVNLCASPLQTSRRVTKPSGMVGGRLREARELALPTVLLSERTEEVREVADGVLLTLLELWGVLLPSVAASPPEPHKSSTLSGRDCGVPKEGAVRIVRGVLPPEGEGHGLLRAVFVVLAETVPRNKRGLASDVVRGVLPPEGEADGVTCPNDGWADLTALTVCDGEACGEARGDDRGVVRGVAFGVPG